MEPENAEYCGSYSGSWQNKTVSLNKWQNSQDFSEFERFKDGMMKVQTTLHDKNEVPCRHLNASVANAN